MNWGKSIVAAFVFFTVFIAALVTVCVRQQISLVSKNYYSEELNYQVKIDQLTNASQLEVKPVITFSNGAAVLQYDDLRRIDHGTINLIRPSDPKYDRSFDIKSNEGSDVRFDVSDLPPGKYNVSFQWKMNGKEYLSQLSLSL